MKLRVIFAALIVAGMAGCGGNSSSTTATTQSARAYNGTASVGDFLTISLDPVAHTLNYNNRSNGDTGTVPYTVNADGTYTLNDPTGNLVAAYEVPDYALLIQAAKTGPNHNTPALITAVESGQISMATWAGHAYNYMQFRTAAGGIEVGSANINMMGDVSNSSYWPYGAMMQTPPFNTGGFDHSMFQNDPSGTFMKMSDGNNMYDYIFGTPNGIFAVDTPNGAILGLQKASSKNFDPTFAGTYKAIYYEKTGATTGQGNVETGNASLGKATLTIGASGSVTMQDGQGNTLVQGTLVPVADATYLYDGTNAKLLDPCFGLFTFRLVNGVQTRQPGMALASTQQDVFVTFMGRALLFSSFTSNSGTNTYDYLYGTGLK